MTDSTGPTPEKLMIPALPPLPGADDLLAHLRSFCLPWRALTIAIDGRNGAGKTSLARYLAWQLGMPVLETDLWLSSRSPVTYRIAELEKLVRSRHRQDRPIIIEGVVMLMTLELLGVQPDYFVFVTNEALESEPAEDNEDRGPPQCLSEEVDAYLREHQPAGRADFHLTWREPSVRVGSLEATADIELA
ncbi:(d)CMP kinase [Belnapia rosea]|uniref:(d)CMP kinase n=1 Tax=Belnapia rosea TaxID=938405 RepID=UPI0008865C39|nr:(d)CMP kinase [Belnapia rosea]SDB74560.1 AAA domain-containing protein [Belnapia rosea]